MRPESCRYSHEWEKTVRRAGRWIDFENDYKTLNLEFMETVWWVFSQISKQGLVYRGMKVSLPLAATLLPVGQAILLQKMCKR